MKNLVKFLYVLVKTGNFTKASFFANWEGATNMAILNQVALKKNTIEFKPTGKTFTNATWHLFGHSLSLLQKSALKYSACEENDKMILSTTCNGHLVSAEMANHESLLCMQEVFEFDTYQCLGSGPCIVVDMGMNIGLASLYLAAMPQVEAVYGYELVSSTARVASRNISANGFARGKVKVRHAGIAATAASIRLQLTGAGDVGASLKMIGSGADTETVELIDAAALIDQLHSSHPQHEIVLKVDCEGTEYEIFERLDDAGMLRHVAACMIEWHGKGAAPLTWLLVKNGFICFTPGIIAAQPTGFVYAVNNNRHL